MTKRAVALFSGGLDSCLALALVARQGVEMIVYHGYSAFVPATTEAEGRAALAERARRLGAREVVFRDQTEAMIAFTKQPRFGYGQNLNACLDCRLLTMAQGGEVRQEYGADFLVSGEVLGQRPMSQRADAMRRVDREVEKLGLGGLVVRPLSAKLLDPTVPEEQGWVRREDFYAISGRSRKEQIALAAQLGITDYPTPAGGCLLTDPGFAQRLEQLMARKPDWTAADVHLLRVGRHYLLPNGARLVASRKEAENDRLEELARPDDALFITREKPGAIVLLRGGNEADWPWAAGLAVYFSKFRAAGVGPVGTWPGGGGPAREWPEMAVVDPQNLPAQAGAADAS